MSYVHGFMPNQQPDQGDPGNLTWLDYIVLSNPQGVMKVLASYGYTGYLAPQDEDEMMDVCYEMMDKYGDQAVIDLLKSHPLYQVMAEMSAQESTINMPFKNASGEGSILATIKTINLTSLLENALIILGAIFLAGKLWDLFTSKDVA